MIKLSTIFLTTIGIYANITGIVFKDLPINGITINTYGTYSTTSTQKYAKLIKK